MKIYKLGMMINTENDTLEQVSHKESIIWWYKIEVLAYLSLISTFALLRAVRVTTLQKKTQTEEHTAAMG